mmetsp:Transcript_129833/g.225649  ORF Transcript_129833/g.225649 Transcript_129833/m.225649 type:complete len:200 (-) Transcript_129833:425-1024(-)
MSSAPSGEIDLILSVASCFRPASWQSSTICAWTPSDTGPSGGVSGLEVPEVAPLSQMARAPLLFRVGVGCCFNAVMTTAEGFRSASLRGSSSSSTSRALSCVAWWSASIAKSSQSKRKARSSMRRAVSSSRTGLDSLFRPSSPSRSLGSSLEVPQRRQLVLRANWMSLQVRQIQSPGSSCCCCCCRLASRRGGGGGRRS